MIHLTPLVQYLLALFAGFYVGGLLHELSHWFVGWLGNTGPTIQWAFYVFPNGVDHGKIETMDSMLIRFAGVAPLLWIPPGFIASAYLLYELSPVTVFIAAVPIFIQVMATESDLIAIRDPEKFREMWIDGDFSRNPLFLPNWIIPDIVPRF